MRASVIAGALLAGTLGCSAGETLGIALPLTDADESAILIVEAGGEQPVFHAFGGDEAPPLRLEGGTAEVDLISFGQTLAELGIQPGPYEPPEGPSLPIGDYRTAQHVQIDEGEIGEWEVLDELPPLASLIRFPVNTSCVRFGVPLRPLRLDEGYWIGPPVELDDEAWFAYSVVEPPVGSPGRAPTRLARTDGRFLEDVPVDLDGAEPGVMVPDGDGGLRLAASTTTAAGNETWIWRGHPDTGFEKLSSTAVRGFPTQMKLHPGAPDELFVGVVRSSFDRRLYRYRVDDFEPELVATNVGNFEVLADGTPIFARADQRGISHVEDGAVVPETIPNADAYDPLSDVTEVTRKMYSIAESSVAGVFAGNSEGQLHRRGEDEIWTIVAENLLSSSMESVVEFEDGVLTGHYHGQLIQYSQTSKWCELVDGEPRYGSVATNLSVAHILPMSGGILVSGNERIDADSTDIIGAYVSFFEISE